MNSSSSETALAPIEQLRSIMATLRSPEGCPWDKEQTHSSIRQLVIEEAYELIEAIEEKNDSLLKEELGDVLLQVIFHAHLAEERQAFTFDDIATAISDKLVRRHPHVFGNEDIETSDGVLDRWQELKQKEKPERKRTLDGIPKGLPALMEAKELGKKASRVGFDWQEFEGVFAKAHEEIDEIKDAIEKNEGLDRIEEEIGDLFYMISNLARHLKIDGEQACRLANKKFRQRFENVEDKVLSGKGSFDAYTLPELDALWDQVKLELKTSSKK